MSILSTNQYNQGISRNKLLSSTSGVGSVITTKAGYYILIADINEWRFISAAHREIGKTREEFVAAEWYGRSQKRLEDLGLSIVDDPRFISFLKIEKELPELICLIEIPHLALNEHFNTINVRDNPIIKQLNEKGERVTAEDFTVFGTHFPKWFRDNKGSLRSYNEWREEWRKADLKMKYFAPPRDAKSPVLGADRKPLPPFKIKDIDGVEESIQLYHELTQTNLALICPNGHLSDIPWSRFLRWKADRYKKDEALDKRNDKGAQLMNQEPCCPSPKLKWSENTTRSEGYSSIYIECEHCHLKENLEGINNLEPFCLGEKPWQLDVDGTNSSIPRDIDCKDAHGERGKMKVALVTGNNMYFANGFSSLFIPQHLIDGIDPRLAAVLEAYEKKFLRYLEFAPNESKEHFLADRMTPAIIASDGFDLDNIPNAHAKLAELFLGIEDTAAQTQDTHEHYRWQEYKCFMSNDHSSEEEEDLSFKDIQLPASLAAYFTKVQQIDELKVCHVQLDFTRVSPMERIVKENEVLKSSEGQNIFSKERSEIFVLPANEIYGEGLFFGFKEEAIKEWYELNEDTLTDKLQALIGTYKEHDQGAGAKRMITSDGLNGAKFLLIHTFSHILMRELEFSCGYPTASLKERLYVSSRMAGLLIYTAEGSEGSMGGLVWQGQTDKIKDLLRDALDRALECSSDPLCWEFDGQGLFELNLAACFSCSLVSETACEQWNLGLDRRMLIDPEIGFFKDL